MVILAALTMPLWGEVLHHHADFETHSDCNLCNLASAPATIAVPCVTARPATLFIVPPATTAGSSVLAERPLSYAPSTSPPDA